MPTGLQRLQCTTWLHSPGPNLRLCCGYLLLSPSPPSPTPTTCAHVWVRAGPDAGGFGGSGPSSTGGQPGTALLDWADKTLGQGLSHVTKSVKTLLAGGWERNWLAAG